MTRRRVIGGLLGAGLLLGACSGSSDATRMWIGPEMVECEGVAPMLCLEVSYSADDEYELFYDQIQGFEYREGTSYVIDVTITEVEEPPADASSLTYTLIDVVEESAGPITDG